MKHFVITLALKASREEIGPRQLMLHDNHFRAGYDLGLVLLYGPLNPSNGYLAIARSESARTLANFLAEDPLVVDHLASVEIREYQPIGFSESLRGWVHPSDPGVWPSNGDCPAAYI